MQALRTTCAWLPLTLRRPISRPSPAPKATICASNKGKARETAMIALLKPFSNRSLGYVIDSF